MRNPFTFKWIVFVVLLAVTGMVQQTLAFEANVSGQVNQLVMFADDGKDSDVFIGDNDNSSTRFRFTANEKFETFTAGTKIELEAQRNASNTFTLPNTDDGGFEFNDRWMELFFDTEFGKFSLGKGDGAANNTSETDLSGTSVIMYAGVNDTAGGFKFVNKDTDTQEVEIGDTRSQFDGLSRNERFRYDTPNFAGFNLAGSVTNGGAWELGVFYASEFGGHKIAASAGYADTVDRDSSEFTQLGVSASWLAPFGLNLTGAYGTRMYQGDTKTDREANGQSTDANNYYMKIGYKLAKIHAFAVEYGITQDLAEKDDKSSNYGFAYVITPWSGVEFYAAVRQYMLDRDGEDYKDFSQIMGGTRIKF